MPYSISILLPDLRTGGAERVSLDLAHEFVRAGHRVEFVLMQARGELLAEAEAAFRIIDLQGARTRDLLRTLVQYLRKRQPDALLAAMWPLSVLGPLGRHLSRHRCRVLVAEHCVLSEQYRDWGGLHRAILRTSLAIGYRLADARVGVSSGVAADVAQLSGLPARVFSVIHNPVRPPEVPDTKSLAVAERIWGDVAGTSKGTRIVTVGRSKDAKNHPMLLRAFARLERNNARLMFVGDSPESGDLPRLAKELGIADSVVFAGFQPDPTPFYLTADLFVLSSDYEGFGNVIVEAMACGTPVVSTDCPTGPREILEDGHYGRLTPVGDSEALAEAMQATLAAPPDSVILQRRAADFAPAIAAAKYLDLIGMR